jgi:hypothetical protein
MLDLNSALIMFVFVTMAAAVAYGLKKLWDIDKKQTVICQNTNHNKAQIQQNTRKIDDIKDQVNENHQDVTQRISVIQSELHDHIEGEIA